MKHNQAEHHEFQFRGVHLPPELIYMICDRKITSAELSLVAIIDALTNRQDGVCFASNRYLGGVVHLIPNRVSIAIAKLRKLGIVRVKEIDGRRHLELAWNRWANRAEGANIGIPPIPGRDRGGIPGRDTINNTRKNKKKVSPSADEGDARSARTPRRAFGDNELLDNNLTNPSPNKVARAASEDTTASPLRGWADRLRKVMEEKLKVFTPWSRSKWIEAFRLLLEQDLHGDSSRIESVLAWYENGGYKQFSITHADRFRKHFAEILEPKSKRGSSAPLRGEVPRELSKWAAIALERLENIDWPKGSKSQLRNVVAASDANFAALVKRGDKFLWDRDKNEKGDTFLMYRAMERMDEIYTHREEFLVAWWMKVRRAIHNWDDWGGNLSYYVFSTDHEWYKQWLAKWREDQGEKLHKQICERFL